MLSLKCRVLSVGAYSYTPLHWYIRRNFLKALSSVGRDHSIQACPPLTLMGMGVLTHIWYGDRATMQRPTRVLVIEDQVKIVHWLATFLEEAHFEVLTAL